MFGWLKNNKNKETQEINDESAVIRVIGDRGSGKTAYMASMAYWPNANPDSPVQSIIPINSVIINHGIALEHSNNIQEAVKVYETYIQKFGDDAFVLFRLGTLSGRIGQWIQAKSYLEKAIQLKPNYAEAHHNQGWVLLNTKNLDCQIENIRELLSAYRQAVILYQQQNKPNLSQTITTTF